MSIFNAYGMNKLKKSTNKDYTGTKIERSLFKGMVLVFKINFCHIKANHNDLFFRRKFGDNYQMIL